MTDYDEKRDFVRMNIQAEVTYTIKNSDGQSHHGISLDLSATGMYMTSDFAPAVDDELEIVMNPNGDRLPPFIATARVLRVTADEKNATKFKMSVELIKSD